MIILILVVREKPVSVKTTRKRKIREFDPDWEPAEA
jgi:hypothetical protein